MRMLMRTRAADARIDSERRVAALGQPVNLESLKAREAERLRLRREEAQKGNTARA